MNRDSLYRLMVQAGMKKIKQTGEGFAALCPFHLNVRSPAWNINSETGAWKCWNPDCNESGSLQQFLTRIVGLSYETATEFVKNIPVVAKTDITANGWNLPKYEERHVSEELPSIPEATLGLYSVCPHYMLKRGFPKAVLREFDIGWDTKGFENPAGSGKFIGANRVTFPVRDIKGRLLGFTRRTVGEEWPKYLHDFEKTKTLYWVHQLVRTPEGKLYVGITEGTTDVMMARMRAREIPATAPVFQGLHNMTATLGGGLSDDQADLIARLSPDAVFLAFDKDVAGIKATMNSGRKLRERGARDLQVMIFPSDDLGELAHDHLVDIESESFVKWLFRAKARLRALQGS